MRVEMSRRRLWAWLQLALLVAAMAWLLARGAAAMGYNWQWYRIPALILHQGPDGLVLGPLGRGLVATVQISILAFLLTLVFGLAAALLRRADGFLGPALATFYVEAIRNTPLLVQLYLVYFVLAPVIGLDRWWAGVLCLAAFEGAFAAEVFRAGLLAVPRGQWEASTSLGLGTLDTYRYVILPQAVRMMLPPLTGIAVALVKHSAIVSVIAVADLTTEARDVISDTFMSFEVWLTVAALYLVLTTSLSATARALEARLRPVT